jgi:hypothetical protein
MSAEIVVKLLDRDLAPVAVIDQFSSLDFVKRYNGVGALKIKINKFSQILERFDLSGNISVERNGVVEFAGPITTFDYEVDTNGTEIIVLANDFNVHLDRRFVYPSVYPFTASEYDHRDGWCETVIREYVDNNLSATGVNPYGRTLPTYVSTTDTAAGNYVYFDGRFQTLLEAIAEIGLAGEVQFDLQLIDNTVGLVCRQPPVNTKATFSIANQNLARAKYKYSVPTANRVVVAGQGEGTARTFVLQMDVQMASYVGPIEKIIDRRDLEDADALTQAATTALAENVITNSWTAEIIDGVVSRYGIDWGLGDIIGIVVDEIGLSSESQVREIRFSYGADGERIEPTIGNSNATNNNVPQGLQKSTTPKRLSILEGR